jgi:hypothetical protein
MAAGDPIDYSAYYGRIATALETLATNSTDIKTSLSSINTHLSTVATNTTTISTNSTTMTTLATGTGIHIVSPYEWLGYASLYKLYVEDTGAIGLSKLSEYKDKIKALPTIF